MFFWTKFEQSIENCDKVMDEARTRLEKAEAELDDAEGPPWLWKREVPDIFHL